ncbi:hypothetical protein CPLU01_05768 [Colletotrichum plurivorum]|uniref:Uncharacterized protein n=1 Tax=Colletotrichum plurivorum TaxID=2175906 RepID=A0A8H6NH13_9PEZI|nr:hypothetical protein CPLU01_05768 [Colletotrichum plurivorum]
MQAQDNTGSSQLGGEEKKTSNPGKPGKTGGEKIPKVVTKLLQRPRRAPKKMAGVASSLDTANDDEYDDAWLPAYEDGPVDEKVVEGDWVELTNEGQALQAWWRATPGHAHDKKPIGRKSTLRTGFAPRIACPSTFPICPGSYVYGQGLSLAFATSHVRPGKTEQGGGHTQGEVREQGSSDMVE